MSSLVADMQNKEYFEKRKNLLHLERQSFIPHWKEISEFIRPRRGRFFVQDRNKGDKRYQSIINSVGGQALSIAKSGMLAGSMSPARPWFTLETSDPDLMHNKEVQEWLHTVQGVMRRIFNESNFYGQAADFLGEMLLFGTATMSHVDDFEDVARFYTHTAGSFMIGTNDRHVVDTLFREFEWTVSKIVSKFGYGNCSTMVKEAYDRGNYDKWFPVCHIVEPNHLFRPTSPFAIDKQFKSVYYEPSTKGQDRDILLSASGFDEFPAHTARWDVTAEDIYGTDCPGMTALGDIKALQIEEKRKAQAIDKIVHPPLSGPPGLRNNPINQLPGGVTLYDEGTGQALKPIYQINAQLGELRADIDAVERRIKSAFFVDLFKAISDMEGIQPRNQLDITQRNEERLLQLGPVLEHIQSEFLEPLIDRTFNQGMRANIFPPIPDRLSDQPLRIKYVSTLATAQKAVAISGLERVVGFVGSMAEVFPAALNKIDAEQIVDEYAQAVGVNPNIIRSDEELEVERQRQEQIEQMQLEAAAAEADAGIQNQQAQTAKTVSEIGDG